MNVNTQGSDSAAGTALGSTYAFPTTFAQQRLWFLEQLQPGGTSYLIPWFLRVTGEVNVEALKRSLNQVIERHEILRTTFSGKDGMPVQVVHSVLAVDLPVRDISACPSPVREAENLAREEARKPLDLESGPLVRAQLLRLSAEDHVLLLTVHHIIFDGGSRRTLVRELRAFYEANCGGKLAQLPLPKLQYPDYAVWQRKHCQGATFEKHLAYWLKQLRGSPASLELPTDHARPAVESFNGAKLPIAISKDLADRVRSFSRSQGVTVFMTLLAAFQTLLSRLSNQDDIVVGTPIANRNRAELEDMIGFFANTLALRTRFGEGASFQDVLAQVKDTTLGAYDHQDLPFEKLVEEIQPERNLGQNPLFQVLFSLQNVGRPDFELPGLKLRFMDLSETAAKFDISVFLSESPDGMGGRFEYNTDLFDRETIERMGVRYRQLLETVVARPEIRVSDIPLVSEHERRQVLTEWNATESDYPRDRCLHQLIEEQAARTPRAIAVRMGEDEISYGSLNERANQLAWALRKRGAGPGQRVGICVERSIPMMVGLVGIMKSGAAYVPLDPAYPAERIKQILEDGQPAVLITQESLAATLPHTDAQLLLVDSDWPEIAKESTAPPTNTATPEDLVYVIFTSGSTGKPKGVEIRHRNVVNLLTFMAAELQMGPRDVFPALASFAFDMSIPELYVGLISGGQVVVADRYMAGDGEALSKLLLETGATIIHATPTTWSLLLQAGFTGKGLKRAIGAEAVPQNLCDRLLEADPSLYEFYGPTETTVWSTFHRFQGKGEPVTVGRPLANTQVYLLDKRLQPVPVGVTGEIYISGDGVARGYLNRADLSQEKFLPDPFSSRPGAVMYKTGDLGRFLRDGRIDFLGRADHQIKLRGYRIELGDIESALNQHPSVRECVVSAREDVPGSQRLVAYVIPVADQTVNEAELRAWLKQRLPEYMVPAAVVELKAFPLTPNGKVDRSALPRPEYRAPGLETGFHGARTTTEEILCTIWSDVLKLSHIGVNDNFFELGGHSLLATQVVARIREVFQIELPLRALFEAPTIADLAEKIAAVQAAAYGFEVPPLKPVGRNQALPLSFAQQRLWFLDKLEPNHSLYNVPQAMRLKGALNPAALERALNEVIARHESLRTTFPTVNGSPVQQIADSLPLTLKQADVSTLPEAVRETEARRLALGEISQPFTLASGPLIRAALIECGQQDHVLVLNTHHIISDRWSMNRLWQEIVEAYEGQLSGVPLTLPPLPIQYADYSVWQREYLSGQILEAQLSYWKKALAEAPTSLELPTDRPWPARQSFRGSRQTVVLPRQLSDELEALSRREGATLFMTLLAAFNVLLMRYSGQDDIVIGSPIAGRTRPEMEKVIGFFVNTLVLRTRLKGNPSFREVLGQVRETALGAYAHQDVPFEKLVEELKPQRDLSRNPLFQVMFTLQNVPLSAGRLRDVEVSSFSLPGESSKFDLTLIAVESREGLRTTLEFNTDLFDATTIERLMRHFEVLLEAAVTNPDLGVRNLPLLTEPERERMVVDWNRTAADYPRERCMYQLFEDQAERTPQAVAARFGGQVITYSELNRRANQVARYLRRLGVGRETLVGFYLDRSLNMLIALLGVHKAGAAYVPLDPAYPAERLRFMVEDAQTAVLLTEQALVGSAPQDAARMVVLDRDADRDAIQGESDENVSPLATPDSRVYVLYTSGSTGKPKGVEIEHRSLTNLLVSVQREPGFTREDRLLAVTTLSFDIAGVELYLPLISGGEIVLASRQEATDAQRLLKLLNDSKPTVMDATPATWRMLIEAGWQGSPGLKILATGEALPGDLSAQLLPRGAELWNMYGPTETTIWSSGYRMKSAASIAPIGRPVANTTYYILDSGMRPVPLGVAGELYIGGEGVARGYLRRPELTEQRFVPDPFDTKPGARLYRTGDLSRYLPDGNVQYLGRTDFQVKLRGFRIELSEIEAVLAQHPAVQQCVVAVREDSPGDKRLIAYVVTEARQHVTISEVRVHLKRSLPDYMLPSAIVELDRLPLTPSGKVDRKALPKPEYAPAAAAMVGPRDEIEAKLLNIWREVLKLSAVEVTDNFFDVGGHSLLAVRMVDEIRKATEVEIPLTALFQGATIEHLANIVRGTETVAQTVVHQLQAGLANRAPFFAAVLAGVNALGYVPLAKHLGPEQPVYALQRPGPGPHAQRRPYSQQEYEEVAAEYVRAMRSIQPNGPYHLGGTCEGARIAFEMARTLEAQRQKVALLAIIDTWVVENTQNRRLWRLYYYSVRLQQNWNRPWKEQLAWARRALSNQIRRWLGAKWAPAKSEWIEVYWPSRDVVPSQVQCPISVYKIPKQPFYYHPDPLLGWGNRTSAMVETQIIPHGRHTFLLREPYVRELAAALLRTLQQRQPASGVEVTAKSEPVEEVGVS
jgi:amino acid adenylation domain-containing protein